MHKGTMIDQLPKKSKRGNGPKIHITKVVLNPLQIDDEPITSDYSSSSTLLPPIMMVEVPETVLTTLDTVVNDSSSKALVVLPHQHDSSMIASADDGDNMYNNEAEVIDIDMTDVMEQRNKTSAIADDTISKALVVVSHHHDSSMIAAVDDDDNNEAEVIDIDMTDVMEQRNKITKKPTRIYKINHIAVTKEPKVEAPVLSSSSVDQTLFQEVISTLLGTSPNSLQNTSQANHTRSYQVKGTVERVYRISSSSIVNRMPALPTEDTFQSSIDQHTATLTDEAVAKDLINDSIADILAGSPIATPDITLEALTNPEPTLCSAEITSVPVIEPSTPNDTAGNDLSAAVYDSVVVVAAKPVRVFRVAQVSLEQQLQRPQSTGTSAPTPLVKPKSFRVISTVTHAISSSSTVNLGQADSAIRSSTEESDAADSTSSKNDGNQEFVVNTTSTETVTSPLESLLSPMIMMPTTEQTMPLFSVSSQSPSPTSLSDPALSFEMPPIPEVPAAVPVEEASRPVVRSRSFRVTGSTVAAVRSPTDQSRPRSASSLVLGLAPVSSLPEPSLSVTLETVDDENERAEERQGVEEDALPITSMHVPRVRYRPALTFIDDTLLDVNSVHDVFDLTSTQTIDRQEDIPSSRLGTDCSSDTVDNVTATTTTTITDSNSVLPETSLRHLQQRHWRQLRETKPLLDATTGRNGGFSVPFHMHHVVRAAAGSLWADDERSRRFVTTSATLALQKAQQDLKEQKQQQEQQQAAAASTVEADKGQKGLEVEDESVLEVKDDQKGESSTTTSLILPSSPVPHQLTTAAMSPTATEQDPVDPTSLSSASSTTTVITRSEMSSAAWPVTVAGQGALSLRSVGGSKIAAYEYFRVEPASLTVTTSSSSSSAAAIAAEAVIFKEDAPRVRGRVLPMPVPLYAKASHLFSTSTDPVLQYEPLQYDDRHMLRTMSTKVHQSMPPLTVLSKMSLSILRAPTLLSESSPSVHKVDAETETDAVAGDEGPVTVHSAFTVSMSLPSSAEGSGLGAESFDSSHSRTAPTMTTMNKSSRAITTVTIRLLPVHLPSINIAGNGTQSGDVSTSTALILLESSSKTMALRSATARRRSQWRKAMTKRRSALPSPHANMDMTLVPYHRSLQVHGHCYDRTMMSVATTANSLILVHQNQQQQPMGNAVVVMTRTSTLTPDEVILLFAARIVALLLLPSALIAWALCRRLLRRSMASLNHWRRCRQEEHLAHLENRAILHMTGEQELGGSRDLDEAIRLLTDALALATTLLRSNSSTTSATSTAKAQPGSSSSGSGGVVGVVCRASVLGLQHLLAKAHAAAGHLWKADEILRETLRGYRKMGRQALYGHKRSTMEVGEEGVVGDDDDDDDEDDEEESIAYGDDDGLVEAGTLEDLGVILWRQAQQKHHRIVPLDQRDDHGGEAWATGEGELSAEGLRLLEEGYDMLMAALKIYEREMIEQLSSIDPEAVRAMYKARLEAEAAAAAAIELMSLPMCGDRDVRNASLRSHSPTSLIHVGDSDDDVDCEAALRDLEESLFARANASSHEAIDTSATGGNSQSQLSKPRLTLAAASSEGTAAAYRWLDVARVRYEIGLIFESTGQCDDSVVIFSEARDMLDELLALDIVQESDDRIRREAMVYANLIMERLTHYSSGNGDRHAETNSRATEKTMISPPVLKLLGSPIAKIARTPLDKKSSVMPQRLQFTPGHHAVIHPYSAEEDSPATCYGHDSDEYDYALLSSENHEEQVKKVNDRSPDTVQAVF